MIGMKSIIGRLFLNRAKLNFWVDVAIGLAGAASAASGLLLLLPAGADAAILWVSLRAWSALHTWSSLAALAGVGLHLALHWSWTAAMARQMLGPARQAQAAGRAEGQAAPVSRRAFLIAGGAVAVAAGLAAAGYRAIAGAEGQAGGSTAGITQESGSTAGAARSSGVACPKGLVNDPYPGRCRHYVDADGDGTCDYSVAGSGSVAAGSAGEGFPPSRGGFGRP